MYRLATMLMSIETWSMIATGVSISKEFSIVEDELPVLDRLDTDPEEQWSGTIDRKYIARKCCEPGRVVNLCATYLLHIRLWIGQSSFWHLSEQ